MDTQAHIYLCIYTYLRLYRGNKGRKTSTTKLKKKRAATHTKQLENCFILLCSYYFSVKSCFLFYYCF